MKNKLSILPVILLTTLLSSCSFEEIFEHLGGGSNAPIDVSIPDGAKYHLMNTSQTTYYDLNQKSYYSTYTAKTVGEAKTLVIPVVISGYEKNATAQNKEKIRKAFFGTSEETGWESVSSYFYKSSHEQLHLTGEVTDWFYTGLTPAQVYQKGTSSGDGGSFYILEKAYEWAQTQGYNLSDYDVDGDGWIDSIWLIYSCPNSIKISGVPSDDNPFWAFTFWDYNYYGKKHTKENPLPNTYGWASYDFMDEGRFNDSNLKVDAHTYIHEMGHVLGLDDYYDYDGLHMPLGAVDMQDYNVGDHNSFSKMAWGWNRAYVVDGECEITIRPESTSGDCIVIKNPSSSKSFNSAFDEYLLLELINQDGLWEYDSKRTYTNGVRAFTKPGVRLTHVDGRIAKMNTSNGSISSLVTNISSTGKYQLAYSNTPSSSYDRGKTNKETGKRLYSDLISIIAANKNYSTTYSTNNSAIADNDYLFKSGSTFSMKDYGMFFIDGKLHDGSTIPYKMTFKNVSSTSATISFTMI